MFYLKITVHKDKTCSQQVSRTKEQSMIKNITLMLKVSKKCIHWGSKNQTFKKTERYREWIFTSLVFECHYLPKTAPNTV